MTIELVRDDKSKKGTHGTFSLGGFKWHSLEPPDLFNAPFTSCVPQGKYSLVPFTSPKYGPCFIMVNPDLNVYQYEQSDGRPDDGRFLCLFVHRGNEVENFVGCCGASHKYDKKNDRLLSSTTQACRRVNKLIAVEGSFELNITHVVD